MFIRPPNFEEISGGNLDLPEEHEVTGVASFIVTYHI